METERRGQRSPDPPDRQQQQQHQKHQKHLPQRQRQQQQQQQELHTLLPPPPTDERAILPTPPANGPQGSHEPASSQLSPSPAIDPNLEPQSLNSSPSKNDPRPVRKRNRKALSCKPCRNMKVKCDRALPCDRCLKNNRVNDCLYDGEPDSKKICISSAEGETRHFEDSVIAKGLSPIKVRKVGMVDPLSNVRKIGTAMTLYKRGKARYVGGSHWVHLFGEFEEAGPWHLHRLKDFSIYRREIKYLKRQFKNKARYNFPFCPTVPVDIKEVFHFVPKRSLAEAYVTRYLETFERSHPLFHEPTFQQEVDSYWKDPKSMGPEWVASFFMMMFLGCWFMPYTQATERKRDVLDALLNGAQTCILLSNPSGKHGISVIRAHCMIIIAKQCDAISHDDSNTASLNMSLITQIAIYAGIHRDPDYFEGMPTIEKFIRRRVWNTVLYMHFQNSMDGGMPILIGSHVHDCPPPLNENDSDVTLDTNHIHPAGSVTDTTHQIILRSVITIGCEIVTPMNNATAEFLPYDVVMKYDYRLTRILDELPRSMSSERYTGSRHDYRARLATQRQLLECFIRAILLVLHRPYAQGPDNKEHYPNSYYAAIKHSIAFVTSRKLLFSDDAANSPNGLWLAEVFKETFTTSILLCYADVRGRENLEFLNDGLGGLSDPAYKSIMDGQTMAEQEAIISEHHFQLFIASALKFPSLWAKKEGRSVVLSDQYISDLKEKVVDSIRKIRAALRLPPFDENKLAEERVVKAAPPTRQLEGIGGASTPISIPDNTPNSIRSLDGSDNQAYDSEDFGDIQKELFDTLMNDPNLMLDDFFTSFVFGGFG